MQKTEQNLPASADERSVARHVDEQRIVHPPTPADFAQFFACPLF